MNKVIFTASILIALVLGGAGMWAYQEYHPATSNSNDVAGKSVFPNNLFNDKSFASAQDPFKEMERMRKQMDQFFKQDDFFGKGGISGNFGSWFNTPQGGFGTKIQRGEDDKSVFYKIKVGDEDLSNLRVNVEHGYVSIEAKLEDKSKSGNSYAASSISENFPVPPGVDPNSAKIDKEGDSVVIRFDKVS